MTLQCQDLSRATIQDREKSILRIAAGNRFQALDKRYTKRRLQSVTVFQAVPTCPQPVSICGNSIHSREKAIQIPRQSIPISGQALHQTPFAAAERAAGHSDAPAPYLKLR